MLLLCPALVRAQAGENTAPQSYTTYIVKWYESLDDVAAKFGVSKEVLMAFNGLQSEKLARRQELKIPDDPASISLDKPAVIPEDPLQESEPQDSSALQIPLWPGSDQQETEPELGPVWAKNHIDAALILPLGAVQGSSKGAYDYYSGAMVAIHDLSDEGLDIDLEIIDCTSETYSLSSMSGKDVVLGPFDPTTLQTICSACPVPVVSPLDPKGLALTDSLSNFIQAPTPASMQYSDALAWLLEDMQQDEDRIILLRESDKEPTPIAALLTEAGVTYSVLSYGILEGRNAISRLEKMMTKTGINRVIIASEDEAFVNDALRNANLMKFREYETVLYSTSKIRSFETIEAENLHNVHAHLSCTYFTDYNSDAVKNFLMRYRALYGSEPTPFAMQGYDTVKYFLRVLATEGSLPARMGVLTEGILWHGLQADFHLVRHGEGMVNNALRRVIYDDNYSTRVIK